MRTGSLLEVAGVLKSLIALHQAKPLSFREKKMLERARYLLVSELAMARNCEESKVEELLSSALSKCKLRFPKPQNSKPDPLAASPRSWLPVGIELNLHGERFICRGGSILPLFYGLHARLP